MEDSTSIRRWKLAERLEQKAQHPNLSPDLAERARRDARALKTWVERHEIRRLTRILDRHKSRESR
jgi:hypothetical protein